MTRARLHPALRWALALTTELPSACPRRSGRHTALWLVAVTALALAAGCSADEGDGALAQLTSGPALDGLVGDAAPASDTAVTTDTSPPTTDAADPDDADADAPLALAGEPCDGPADCLVGACVATREGLVCPTTCSTTGCPSGQICRAIVGVHGDPADVCVPVTEILCLPCDEDADCNIQPGDTGANRCISHGDAGRFCGLSCDTQPGCPGGTTCASDGQCRAPSGACAVVGCSPLAVSQAAFTPCARTTEAGSCKGVRRCTEEGLSACDAATPSPELCNGVDDDCDAETDEALAGDGCGAYACGGADGCLARCDGPEDCAIGLICDVDDKDGDGVRDECVPSRADGSPCSDDDGCESGHCANGRCCSSPDKLCCATDGECAALDEAPICSSTSASGCTGSQIVGRCEAFACVERQRIDPSVCAARICVPGSCNGPVFAPPSTCTVDGACAASGNPRACDDQDACTFDSCSATQGCLTSPRSGPSDTPCYEFDAVYRGVGACRVGVLGCQGGAATECVGDVGPAPEACNGVDDDCDGQTDKDVAGLCAPYTCGGAGGCLTSCAADDDCSAGSFCDDGACRSFGGPGASCDADGECQGGHCDNGVCCAEGRCCLDDQGCAALDAEVCDAAGAQGCAGRRIEGFCGDGFRCATREVADPTVCEGEACTAAVCDDDAHVAPARLCGATGTCELAPVAVDCYPYRCAGGVCEDTCDANGGCAPGATCTGPPGARRCRGNRADGQACVDDVQCSSEHCNNGFCCDDGVCCSAQSDCAMMTQDPVCDDVEDCEGRQVVGVCSPQTFQCSAQTQDTPLGCVGEVCGDAECVNLAGGQAFKEGVRRDVCNAAGACVEELRDCRDADDAGYCTENPGWIGWCDGCESGGRDTCVIFTDPCYCE